MLVYLRNQPGTQQAAGVFHIEAAGSGAAGIPIGRLRRVPSIGGCVGSASVQGKTLTEIAAEMWNHAPRMAAAGAPAVTLTSGQMRDLVSSFWAAKFFEDAGRPASGSRVFRGKNCATCHNDASSGAPHLPVPGREFQRRRHGFRALAARTAHAGSDEIQGPRLAALRWRPDGGPDRLLELQVIHEQASYSRPTHQQLDQHAGRRAGHPGRILLAVRVAVERQRPSSAILTSGCWSSSRFLSSSSPGWR